MGKAIVSPEEAEELRKLYAEHLKATRRAENALTRTPPPGHVLEGEALTRAVAADAEVAAISRRIKEILGD